MAKEKQPKQVEVFKHTEDKRKNNPTAEAQSLISASDAAPKVLRYPRNPDLDPQLVWRGKDAQDAADLAVQHTPLYIQEKVHPKVLIEDLLAQTKAGKPSSGEQLDLFSDFNGVPAGAEKTEFYQHDQNWTNRMILGDSLNVMTSLAEREGLRGKVQAIYIDPPYGIKFNSNFQWSTTSRDVKDGNADHITREPEQVKAFRDTWRDGIHSYLNYLRDRLTVARDLLAESGSIFVQIGDENMHRVRLLLDEVFGPENCVMTISMRTAGGQTSEFMAGVTDYLLWYGRDANQVKTRPIFRDRDEREIGNLFRSVDQQGRKFGLSVLMSASGGATTDFEIEINGVPFKPARGRGWRTNREGMNRLMRAGRLHSIGNTPGYVLYPEDFPVTRLTNFWGDVMESTFAVDKWYVVQTAPKIVQRAILLSTDPGDLVLDPTCGSGTTAMQAEAHGRRWITIDTSRVALALARARLMGAKFPAYILLDSQEGQDKSRLNGVEIGSGPTHRSVRHGFVYERVPHINLRAVATNAEIDVIWDKWSAKINQLREQIQKLVRNRGSDDSLEAADTTGWSDEAVSLRTSLLEAVVARQTEINHSIAARAEYELLRDRPFESKRRVRVAGPFTVESLSPHRSMIVDVDGGLVDPLNSAGETELGKRFTSMILENLKAAGVQQADKSRKIDFTSVVPWSGKMVCAEGRYMDETGERRAAIFVGPEFGTVLRADLVEAAREASDGGFHVLIACAFNYEAHATEFDKLGAIPVLKARMNADLHMGSELKETSKANLFVVFGEPDIELQEQKDGRLRVEVKGVDVFKPQTGEVVSEGPDGIACWFIDTDYNEESFFVRHAYFLGADDPYDSLKRTLKAEINEEAWESLHSAISRPFDKPKSGRIAVKVINHLGDEVMKVYKTS